MTNLSTSFEELKQQVQKILNPISPPNLRKESNLLYSTNRTNAGRNLPSYYLVYFLFIELLDYQDRGQHEKVAWSIPIEYNGTVYFLEHRKLGLGLFASNKTHQESECEEIVKRIQKAVKSAQPFFDAIANEAAKKSKLNVLNHSLRLYDRYTFFVQEYKRKAVELNTRKNQIIQTQLSETQRIINIPFYELKRESEWLALAAIDAFFSFTEHIFIHAAILNSRLLTGEDVADLTEKDWATKFKASINIQDPTIKLHYDKLVVIKNQIRNYIAHGAFGKNGEAFQFHSAVGAVPMLMPHQIGVSRFSIQGGTAFQEQEAITAIEQFMEFYWESNAFPEIIYIQSSLPSILSYAADNTYKNAMTSISNMESFIEYLSQVFDNAANMDW